MYLKVPLWWHCGLTCEQAAPQRDSVSPPEKVSQESLHAQPHSQPHPPLSLPQAHHLTPIPWNWPCSPCPGPQGSPGGSVWASGDTHFCPFLCSPPPPSTLVLSPLPLSCLSSIHLGTPTPCHLSAFQNSKTKPNLSRQAPQTKSYDRALPRLSGLPALLTDPVRWGSSSSPPLGSIVLHHDLTWAGVPPWGFPTA